MADTKTSALSAITGANTATGDQFLVLDTSDTTQGAGGTLKNITRAELAAALAAEGVGANSVAAISDTKASGSQGGTFTSGAWQTRDLNTEDYDPDGIVSIASNQFTLQAGTYHLAAKAPAYTVNAHSARLYNATDASSVLLGTTEYAGSSTFAVTSSEISGFFTIASAKAFEIQHRCSTTGTTSGFGAGGSMTWQNAVFTTVTITKIA